MVIGKELSCTVQLIGGAESRKAQSAGYRSVAFLGGVHEVLERTKA